MSLTVCLAPANTVAYPNGGGHLWVYLHWALALKALGCRVIWLEGIDVDDSDTSPAGRRRRRGGRAVDCVATLKTRLEPYGLADTLALYAMNGAAVPEGVAQGSLDLDDAAGADLLLNLWHSAPAPVVQRFRRSAFVDTDPGLLQIWMATGAVDLAPHDIYFTIGETVGQPGARFPDGGRAWLYTPPPIFLPEWPALPPSGPGRYTRSLSRRISATRPMPSSKSARSSRGRSTPCLFGTGATRGSSARSSTLETTCRASKCSSTSARAARPCRS